MAKMRLDDRIGFTVQEGADPARVIYTMFLAQLRPKIVRVHDDPKYDYAVMVPLAERRMWTERFKVGHSLVIRSGDLFGPPMSLPSR